MNATNAMNEAPRQGAGETAPPNRLYYGDCLTIMQDMPAGSVDLIYLDPPFNSNRAYNAIYRDETGRPLPDQIEAFCDLWELDIERERVIRELPAAMRAAGIDDATAEFWRLCAGALRNTQPKLLAYLSYMVERLLVMKRLLKSTGTIYLHCDPTASHYIKIMMDAIFGDRNFVNEITWKRYAVHSLAAKGFDNVSDIIFLYGANRADMAFNKVYGQATQGELSARFPHTEAETGRRYQHAALEKSANRYSAGEVRVIDGRETVSQIGWIWSQETFDRRIRENPYLIYWTRNGRPRYKIYADEYRGVPLGNIWTDIGYLSSGDKERLGYATQKPIVLLNRIIQASSNPGDLVLDPFCGCATTIEAAHWLNRRWVGIDIAIHAIKRVSRVRLQDRCGLIDGRDYEIRGMPRNLEGAQDLWQRDTYQFQKWAVEQVDGFVTSRRSADGGIDGRLYFAIPNAPDLQSMVIEVKGGARTTIRDVRALHSVLERDQALLAGLIVMHPPGARQRANFEREMAQAGDLEIMGARYPRMQLLTVAEILDGRRFNTPGVAGRRLPQPVLPLG